MVRQKSGGEMASPTPSIDSLNGAAVGSLCGDQTDHCSVESGLGGNGGQTCSSSTSSERASSTGSSGLGSSPLGGSIFNSVSVKCTICTNTFNRPKVLPCFHTFCQLCLEKIQDHPDRITCPTCRTDCSLGGAGVAGLVTDFGITGLLDHTSGTGVDLHTSYCTSCKNRDLQGIARCFDCATFLCANCVTAHRYMHCFEGHRVVTLGEITSKEGSRHEVSELDSISSLVQEGKTKATDMRNSLKTVEGTAKAVNTLYLRTQNEIAESFHNYQKQLEERKNDLLRDLEQIHSSKQFCLSAYSQKAQDTVDKIYQVTDFIERLMKHASNTEVLHFKRLIENKFLTLKSQAPSALEVSPDAICDFEFVANFQEIPGSIKGAFGHLSTTSQHTPTPIGAPKPQAPISRPTTSRPQATMETSLGLSQLSNGLAQGIANIPRGAVNATANQLANSLSLNGGLKSLLMDRAAGAYGSGHQSPLHQQQPPQQNGFDGFLGKRFGSPFGPLTDQFGLLNREPSNQLGACEKWSNGSDRLLMNLEQSFENTSNSFGLSSHDNHLLDLSSKLLQHQHQQQQQQQQQLHHHQHHHSQTPPATAAAASGMFPPKSQIKRQKMIYHCKFGEFGVLEGQFTEPSGVAVNAQNDIIVADTNNHRIQIFDKEGRFKFQFGECGKRDGQLLYPNRVAVVRQSGDIIVTERSPTHQVQIYNQYGQFVRKFGANILQHPRGVCVDNKGRIIVVECKVMRVIIFDQMGNVLNKFGCSKHLEFPNGVVVNDRQEIFISDNRAHCVKVFNYEGTYLRQIGGEGITNYPIGVGINSAGEVTIADNHNNFNLTVFTQDGQLISALESKVKHAQCFDVSLMDDGSVVLASKDYRLYIYRYVQIPPIGL